ncbi:MAG: hypothetical protein H7Y13_11805 [Sphingobacteriaceae bacterium]|nr:hypothetical protein [Sphingobacteriaceae bacterium]
MEITAFVDLFKSYCANYQYKETPVSAAKPIYFVSLDVANLTAALKDIRFPALFLMTPESDFGGETIDNITESQESTYIILQPLPKNDISRKEEVQDSSKKIADEFIRRLLHDHNIGVIQGFNIAGIKSGPIERTADSLYGWEVSFNLVEDFDGEINTAVWGDLD